MDLWPSEPQRQKRSFDEMSQQATLSPSPIHRFFGISNFSRFTGSAPSSATSGPSERRRLSHPHNPPQQFQRRSENMADTSHPPQRPRLSHQASNTIDLTSDAEDEIAAPRIPNRERSRRPPQLGRSDAQALENIIDLTDDNDVDLMITSSRQLPLPNPNVIRPPPPVDHGAPAQLFGFHQQQMDRIFGNDGPVRLNNWDPTAHTAILLQQISRFDVGNLEMPHFEAFNNGQAMPGRMDYQREAFANQKPNHVPPPSARKGFTRSPTESDTVICPSCEEELVHRKDIEDLVIKKGGKAPTKKEREEHPFWVIRECGHVYCNNCYQNRVLPTSKRPHTVSFPERPSGKAAKKVPFCAVEDCQSEVKGKEKWVGVFL